MRLNNGKYECVVCGAVLDVPVDKTPRVTITASTGAVTMRTIRIDGKAVHSCALGHKK